MKNDLGDEDDEDEDISVETDSHCAADLQEDEDYLLLEIRLKLNTTVNNNIYVLMSSTTFRLTMGPSHLLNTLLRLLAKAPNPDSNHVVHQHSIVSVMRPTEPKCSLQCDTDIRHTKGKSTRYQQMRNRTHVQQAQVRHHHQRLSVSQESATISNPVGVELYHPRQFATRLASLKKLAKQNDSCWLLFNFYLIYYFFLMPFVMECNGKPTQVGDLDEQDLPDELIFHINYLGADQPTFTLNFSKGSPKVVREDHLKVGKGTTLYP
ncbi:glutamate decarboxylase [Tanacetum coccineum]